MRSSGWWWQSVPTALIAALVPWIVGCAGPAMPPSWPLQGQNEERMARDREECRRVATTGAGTATYWLFGGETSLVGEHMARQRQASFNACMESRGYRTVTP